MNKNLKTTCDVVDKARFGRLEVAEELQEAFQTVFAPGQSVDLVLEYLTDFAGYGFNATDPAIVLVFAHRQQVLMEIKKMIGAAKTFSPEVDNQEATDNETEK